MSRSTLTRVIAAGAGMSCMLSLAACASPSDDEAADASFATQPESTSSTAESTTSAAEKSEPSTTTTADDPTKTVEDTAPLSHHQQQAQANDPKPAFGGMGTPSLEDQRHLPPGLGGLVPTGIRVAAHDSFTRVVVDLEGDGEAGWFTSYTDQPGHQASGLPVEVKGATFLNLGIEGTPWPSTPELEQRFMDSGITPGAGVVQEINYTTTFEAQTQLVIGLKKQTPYSVTFLQNPKRLVLDFQN
ncbi:AMIN domain-containing protein [Corynebacterium accolens]|uniref:AMIN domain-containing protein n=1 Tax=Corynebacterium accolens TaxID=38284 RepID=A0ABT7FNC7_9CORY|nr:AMIN domain-containing protein [Corynebacterium accolens]MDK4247088.1 AMIN domain-containing protein [Corynebacterium accolens]MDK4323161.1 AMIN domain-containing protein [Corynebacterium accolens]